MNDLEYSVFRNQCGIKENCQAPPYKNILKLEKLIACDFIQRKRIYSTKGMFFGHLLLSQHYQCVMDWHGEIIDTDVVFYHICN